MDIVGRYRPGCRTHPYRWTCKECGTVFEATRCTAMLCSPACRKARSRAIQAQRDAERLKMASQNAPGSQKSGRSVGLVGGKKGSAAIARKAKKGKKGRSKS